MDRATSAVGEAWPDGMASEGNTRRAQHRWGLGLSCSEPSPQTSCTEAAEPLAETGPFGRLALADDSNLTLSAQCLLKRRPHLTYGA